MITRFRSTVLFSVSVLCLGLVLGCGQQDDQAAKPDTEKGADVVDPHDVPITEEQTAQLKKETAKFADAVAKVKELRDAVEKETKDGIPENPFEAHQALDKAEIILPWFPQIAQDSGIPKEQWAAVNTAATEIREMFDEVHLNIDADKDPGFAAVKDKMDARIAELEAIAQE